MGSSRGRGRGREGQIVSSSTGLPPFLLVGRAMGRGLWGRVSKPPGSGKGMAKHTQIRSVGRQEQGGCWERIGKGRAQGMGGWGILAGVPQCGTGNSHTHAGLWGGEGSSGRGRQKGEARARRQRPRHRGRNKRPP